MQHDAFIAFDSAQTELQTGINLIEASAGTGKTFAIAMLVLRFVVELAISIDKILVVTFTTAATEELRDRVRSRLVEARKNFANPEACDDTTLRAWFVRLSQLNISQQDIKQRLDAALLDIDQASIFTIHSFCKKVLREHALESGQLFDAELTDDLTSIKQACADDFWRKTCYTRSLAQVAILTAHYDTPDKLLNSIQNIAERSTVYPALSELESLDSALQTVADLMARAKTALANSADVLQTGIAADKFKGGFMVQYATVQFWLEHQGSKIPDAKSLQAFSSQGLLERLNGNQFKTNKTQTSDQRKADYLTELAIDTTAFDELTPAIQRVSLILRCQLLDNLRTELDRRLQQLNLLSFDQLISRLSDALTGEQGEFLTEVLRTRFSCALIDEFQDTDNEQWTIFSTVFAAPEYFLYLIGDPKQAIYKFRGADIYSYLAAQQQAQQQFTLNQNWRSHPRLVEAVNTLFQQEHPFILKELAFHPVTAANSTEKGELTDGLGVAVAPMMLWHAPSSKKKSDTEQTICTAVCQEIVQLLTTDNYRIQPHQLAVQPKHIAILVKKNEQAGEYQAALREVGVPAVLNSKESVFASSEAIDLYRLLQAIANPSDSGLLKQALTLSWFGLDGQGLYKIFNNEMALDDWMSRFLGYYQDWQKVGLMTMLQRLINEEQIRLNLANTNLVERQLTNIYHLVELVHQAATDEHLGINKTLDWLQAALQQAKTDRSDNQALRLESDDDALQIVTMHSSKGLEYEIVFCPHLWQYDDRLNKADELIVCHEQGDNIADLGSAQFEQRRQQAILEQQAEDMRVLYVALTRAKLRCYMAWTDEKNAAESALARLLGLADLDDESQQARLQSLVEQHPDRFDYQQLQPDDKTTGYYQKSRTTALLQVRPRHRLLYTYWQMSSYTALSALSIQETPELPEDKADETELALSVINTEELPKGAAMGNVVHDLLEHQAFNELAAGEDISEERDKLCQRYSIKLNRPELLNELLANVVTTPLAQDDNNFCLMNLPASRCLKEMPFYLAIPKEMDAQKINDILHDSPSYQTLSSKKLCGYLTGFIDLICEYQGRYYVMDYKTNTLSDYKPESLTLAMREHNYGLQYWLYTVVLHRYLQNRLQNYDYEQDFGGVRYLFVRGMSPTVAMSGVYQDRPDLARIQRLSALLAM